MQISFCMKKLLKPVLTNLKMLFYMNYNQPTVSEVKVIGCSAQKYDDLK